MKTLFPHIDEVENLKVCDERMCQLVDRFGYIDRPRNQEIFFALVDNIVSQQISIAVAKSIMDRLRSVVGEITPANLFEIEKESLCGCGISSRKVEWLKSAAQKFLNGELSVETLSSMSDKDVVSELVKLDGVGVWTAEMLMIFALGRSNVLSFNDLIIRRAIQHLYNEKELTKKRFENYRKLFSPHGTVASFYLWAYGNSLPKSNGKINIRSLNFKKLRNKNINYTFQTTQHGDLLVASTRLGVCWLGFINGKEEAVERLKEEFNRATFTEATDKFQKETIKVLLHNGGNDITLHLQGTPFELKVWRALIKIPRGITASYSQISKNIKYYTAHRAVGNAIGANPVVILIPCHRVIRSSGDIGNFSAGVERKIELLKYEKQ